MNLIPFIIECFLYFYSIILLYISYFAKKKNEKGACLNNLTISLALIFSLTINILIVNVLNISNIDFIVFPFDIFMLGFILMFLPSFLLVILNEKKKLKTKEPTSAEKNAFPSQVLPLKYDIYRKLTHLVVLGIILFYFTLGFWIQTLFIYILNFLPTIVSDVFFSLFLIEDNIMIFTQYLVVFLVGISLIGLLTADFIRILKPEIYPLKPINQLLREKELNYRLGPQISMAIGCFSIIILFGLFQPTGPLIICTSMVMAIFGDMASNLIGRIFGRKKIRKSNKTFEGLIAGILVAFFTGLVFLIMLNEMFVIYPINFLFYPLIGALLIGLIDYLDLEIDDNLLNPIVVSSILFFIHFFLS